MSILVSRVPLRHGDHYVHTRPGADIAFIGGLINYVLEHDYWFKEYVINYTNAATLIDPGFESMMCAASSMDGILRPIHILRQEPLGTINTR